MQNSIPNSFIDLGCPRRQNIDFDQEARDLLCILDSAEKESDVQQYIKKSEKWFIPGSLFKCYDFGHHEAYLVPEQALGAEYRVDYLLLGRNSIGYQIVLVEFEDVNTNYRLSTSNAESLSVRNGLIQIQDWKRWLDENRAYFLNSTGLSGIGGNIPSWGIHYCLVVGRRDRMDDVANQMRGQRMRESPGLTIVSYDRLVDNTRLLSTGF